MMEKPDGELIRDLLPDPIRARCSRIDVFSEIESTNSYLLDQPGPAPGSITAVIADLQTAGRGRLANSWASPRGAGLYLSASCSFADMPDNLPAMSLAVGVAVAEALESLGVDSIELKWPNDIVYQDGKLGGILLEVARQTSAATTLVVGIGINIRMREAIADDMARLGRVADLAEAMDEPPSRDTLAAAVLAQVTEAVDLFSDEGLAPFMDRWTPRDWLKGKQVTVQSADSLVSGTVSGLSDDGALLLDDAGDRHRVVSGSVRLQSAGSSGGA